MTDLGAMSRVDALLAAIGPVEGARVIDIGCGEGEIARGLAAAGAEVIGYDPFIVEQAIVTIGSGSYRLSHAKASAIPEPDASADVVLFVFSLHHVPQASMPAALAEARRILKPGGRLCVAEPIAEGPGQYVMAPYHDETAVRANAIAALSAHAAPSFAEERVLHFSEERIYPDFAAYLDHARLGMRYNGYGEEAFDTPEVRGRFDEMYAIHDGRLEQPCRINLFA